MEYLVLTASKQGYKAYVDSNLGCNSLTWTMHPEWCTIDELLDFIDNVLVDSYHYSIHLTAEIEKLPSLKKISKSRKNLKPAKQYSSATLADYIATLIEYYKEECSIEGRLGKVVLDERTDRKLYPYPSIFICL